MIDRRLFTVRTTFVRHDQHLLASTLHEQCKREIDMAGRLDGKRVIVTDCNEYNGADIVKLFREEGAEVFADSRDLTVPTASDELVREVGRVDILIANLAYPHKFAPVCEKSDEDMEYAFNRIVYPLHRLTRAVLPQMLERKKGKIVVVGSAASLRGRKRRRFDLWSRARRAARLYEERGHGGRPVRQHQRYRSDLRGQLDLLAPPISRDRGISATPRGVPRGATCDGTRMRTSGPVSRWA